MGLYKIVIEHEIYGHLEFSNCSYVSGTTDNFQFKQKDFQQVYMQWKHIIKLTMEKL